MDAHLSEEFRAKGNLRNGKTKKQVQTSAVEISVETLRDRDASFDPQLSKET